MKTYLTALVLSLLFSAICITGCKKDETIEDNLVGSYYSGFAYTGGGYYILGVYIDRYDVYWSYRFIDKSKAERTANEKIPYGSIIGSPENYTYTYSYPTITLVDKDGVKTTGTFLDKNTFRIGNINYQKQ